MSWRTTALAAASLLFGTALALFALNWELGPKVRKFAEAYRERHLAGDVRGLMDLVYLEDANDSTRRLLRFAFAEETRWPLADLEIWRASPDAIEEIWAGVAAGNRPDIEPRYVVRVKLDTSDSLTATWLAGTTAEGEVKLLVTSNPEPSSPPPQFSL
jgi:hypothetical protein